MMSDESVFDSTASYFAGCKCQRHLFTLPIVPFLSFIFCNFESQPISYEFLINVVDVVMK